MVADLLNQKHLLLSQCLLLAAANHRQGLVMKPQVARTGVNDVPGIFHVGVPNNSDKPWQSASGGVGITELSATLAAIGEGVERYAATLVKLPIRSRNKVAANNRLDPETYGLFTEQQRAQPDFPFPNLYAYDAAYTNVYDFQNNQEHWTTHGLVALSDEYQVGVPTSSGLAAGSSRYQALVRAIQELIERDALMTTWLHSLPGRRIKISKKYQDSVANLQGEVFAFDLTPRYSPHPVCAIAGMIPERGKPRYSLGVACRETWEAALEKAYFEWCQGVFFAGYYRSIFPDQKLRQPADVKSFDDHAIYYTLNPDQWSNLPLLSQLNKFHKPFKGKQPSAPGATLKTLKSAFKKSNIRLFYREITTIDALQAGVYVMRTLSPDMAPIFAHQNWPFLGGAVGTLTRCYPYTKPAKFPNLMPHPLG